MSSRSDGMPDQTAASRDVPSFTDPVPLSVSSNSINMLSTLVAKIKEEKGSFINKRKNCKSTQNREYRFNGTFCCICFPKSYLHLEAELLSVREYVKVTDR